MRVLIPLPLTDFDPTETAVPWRTLTNAGVDVTFATPDGTVAAADNRMLSGRGLGPWKPILRADTRSRQLYEEMASSAEFGAPASFDALRTEAFDGLVLPGGHAPGMKPYLESTHIQNFTAGMLEANRAVGAICHGVLVLARTSREDGTPVLRGRRVTALTKSMELSAWGMTGLWLGSYYRTYPETVQDEVERAQGPDGSFEEGPFAVFRDSPERLERGFTVIDRNLITARWPGDAHRFSQQYLELLSATTG